MVSKVHSIYITEKISRWWHPSPYTRGGPKSPIASIHKNPNFFACLYTHYFNLKKSYKFTTISGRFTSPVTLSRSAQVNSIKVHSKKKSGRCIHLNTDRRRYNMKMEKNEIRAVIKYLCFKKMSTKDIHSLIPQLHAGPRSLSWVEHLLKRSILYVLYWRQR